MYAILKGFSNDKSIYGFNEEKINSEQESINKSFLVENISEIINDINNNPIDNNIDKYGLMEVEFKHLFIFSNLIYPEIEYFVFNNDIFNNGENIKITKIDHNKYRISFCGYYFFYPFELFFPYM